MEIKQFTRYALRYGSRGQFVRFVLNRSLIMIIIGLPILGTNGFPHRDVVIPNGTPDPKRNNNIM